MDIIFLGTSAGVPTKRRNVSAIAVTESQGRDWYLIDCGEGTQQQLLYSSLSLHTLRAILITHIHGDHCYGLTGLLASAGMSGRKAPLTIVAPKGIQEWIEASQQHTQLYIPYELNFVAVETLTELCPGPFTIHTTELSHRVPSFAYRLTETHADSHLDTDKLTQLNIPRGPIWGKLKQGFDVEHNDQVLHSSDFIHCESQIRQAVICGDNENPVLLSNLCKGCDLLVHEATYTEEVAAKAGDVGHSYAGQVASFAHSAGIPNLILTHFSPRYQADPAAPFTIEQIREEAVTQFSGQLFMAEDFDRYSLKKNGEFSLAENQRR